MVLRSVTFFIMVLVTSMSTVSTTALMTVVFIMALLTIKSVECRMALMMRCLKCSFHDCLVYCNAFGICGDCDVHEGLGDRAVHEGTKRL